MAVSRTVVYGGLAIAAIAVYWWSGSAPEAKAATATKHSAATYIVDSEPEYIAADYSAHFGKPKPATRNLFFPLVVSEKPPSAEQPTEKQDIIKVPGNLADGDGGWTYTGFAIVDGERMALLENAGTHKAGYVKEGEDWKKAHVRHITAESIVMADQDGVETVVLRYNPDLAKKLEKKDEPIQPVNPGTPLQGPIGPPGVGAPNVQIVPAPGGQGVRIIRGK